ncbi:MAG: UvrD-helicase domain-containing protein [Anaerolineales bacterium]|nr:UvrD-helicase domain-containing protein [Anaerolineales bacterium]
MNPPDILQTFPLSLPQQAAALARGSDVAVTAGAGTGKTRTLVGRYLALLADGLPLRRIVAITFTRKAAREMRNRVRKEIAGYLAQPSLSVADRQRWQGHFNRLDAARIGTIHNLCSEILHAHPAEVGIDPRFTVLDETQATLLVQEAAEATLAWMVADEQALPLLALLRERPLLNLITTLLTNRLAVRDVVSRLPADTVLGHWEAQLAARQAEQLQRLLVDPAFVEAHCHLQTNQSTNPDDKCELERQTALAALDIPSDATVTDVLRQLSELESLRTNVGSQKNWSGETLQEIRQALRYIKAAYKEEKLFKLSINDQDEAIAAAMPAIYRLFQYAQQVYYRLKSERDALDFDDLEALAIHVLETFPAIRSYWQDQMQALLVDEFQDTNARQARFIRLLCPDAGKLFIVGDAKRSIYRFRGADVTVFAAEKGQIQRAQGTLVDLDTSYRAHEQLLTDMNELLAPVLGADLPNRPPWVAPFAPLSPGTKVVAADLTAPFVEFHLTIGKKAEALPPAAAALADRLQRLHEENGLSYGDMAILCRASGSFQYYEDALDNAGIPYLTVAGKGFYDRPEIRDLLNALQAIADPHDDLALVGLLRSPACGVSDVALYHLAASREAGHSLWDSLLSGVTLADAAETERLQTAVSLIASLNQQAGRIPVANICKQFLDRTYYRAILRRAGQPRALRNVTKLLIDIHSSELVSITEFLEYAQALHDSGSREGEARGTSEGVVQIMSIHAAKGLEFPVVALGDASSGSNRTNSILVDGGLGILLATKDEDNAKATSYELGAVLAQEQEQAEKDRLLYVALTRAEQMLLINGTIQQNTQSLSWNGWLGQLADITGLRQIDLSSYDETGGNRHTFDLFVQDSAVQAIVYEPNAVTPSVLPTAADDDAETAPTLPSLLSLQDSLIHREREELADEETPQRVWQVVPIAQRPQAPAWVIGSIVHEALSLWRFPDSDFEAWVTARAREYGLTDLRQLQHAHTDTVRLLNRFMQHPRFREMQAADRRLHEVPYSHLLNETMETGYIDLLYQTDGVWKLVDFKTDRIQDEAALQQILREKDYQQQVRRYGTAVQKLLGVSAQLELCWLDYPGNVRFTMVAPLES